MEGRPSPITFRQVLKNRRFFLLWLALLVSNFGDWLAIFALFSLVAFRLRGTPSQVAGVLISLIIPWTILAPLAGVFVDRWNLKGIMIASDLTRAVIAVLLAQASGLYQIYFLVFLLSAVSCFFQPAQNVAIPLLVSKPELLVANALNAQTIQFNKIVSPALAGLLVAWAGEKACFYVDSFSFVFSAGVLSLIVMARPGAGAPPGIRSILGQLAAGWNFIVQHRAVGFVTFSMVVAFLALGAFDSLVAVYVRDILHARARTFGALVSLAGVGTIAGAVAIGKFAQRQSRVNMVAAGIVGLGLGIFGLGCVKDVAVALAVCVGLGLAGSAIIVPSQTLVQEETPQAVLGRVSSTSSALITVAQLASITAAGKIANWMGIRKLYGLLGAALILVGCLGFLYAKVYRVAQAKTLPVAR